MAVAEVRQQSRRAGAPLADLVAEYASHHLFRNTPDAHVLGNPYRRPLYPETLDGIDFSRPIREGEFSSYGSLVANRILLNFYESESIILPASGLATARKDFEAFYDDELRQTALALRPELERYAFAFLDDAVDVAGTWTTDLLRTHFLRIVEEADAEVTPGLQAIRRLGEPRDGVDMLLIQLALDGLTEASAMARNLGGSYGPEQSELFKIFIDEFGAGVFEAKHSTIFEKLIASRGLKTDVHAYWHFYLTGSIAIINYFNYLTDDHRRFFRYAGALTFAEWTFAKFFTDLAAILRDLFGDAVDTHYCDEHGHIDVHHGRMTFENLLLGLARKHGDDVIPDLVRGVEEIRLLARLTDEEFIRQVTWADELPRYAEEGRRPPAAAGAVVETASVEPGHPFGTRTYDEPTVVSVEAGEVELLVGGENPPFPLRAGDAMLVPAGCLHGLRARTRSDWSRSTVAA
jgi:quercetin dioxygenase-like cupin family protein